MTCLFIFLKRDSLPCYFHSWIRIMVIRDVFPIDCLTVGSYIWKCFSQMWNCPSHQCETVFHINVKCECFNRSTNFYTLNTLIYNINPWLEAPQKQKKVIKQPGRLHGVLVFISCLWKRGYWDHTYVYEHLKGMVQGKARQEGLIRSQLFPVKSLYLWIDTSSRMLFET